MKDGAVVERLRLLFRSGDPELIAQARELLEVVGTPAVFEGLCEGIGLDRAGVPSPGHGTALSLLRDLTLRMSLATWMLRRAGHLDGVKTLSLSRLSREGFASVEGLASLEHLTLRDVPWGEDLSPLLTLPALKSLSLVGSGFQLSALAGHPTLQEVTVSEYSEETADVLDTLPALERLSLTVSRGSTLMVPRGLPALTKLSAYIDPTDLSWVRGFPGLSALSLQCVAGSHFTSLAQLAGLTGLVQLTLQDHNAPGVLDLTPLSGLTDLASLSLPGHHLVDFTPLHSLPALRDLTLRGGGYTANPLPSAALYRSLRPMSRLLDGVGLDQTGTPVRDGAPMTPQAQLFALHVAPPPGEAHPLADAQRLTLLRPDRCALDLSPIAGMPRLRWLETSSMDILDLTPVALLPSLVFLSGREKAEGRDAVRRVQRRLAQSFLRHTRFHRTARDEAWLEQLRTMGLIGSRRRRSPPAGISRLLSSNRIEDVLSGFEALSELPDDVFTQRIADGISLLPTGQLVLTHAAEKAPHLRRRDRRAFCALMALRVSGRLEGAEHIHLGLKQPLTALDPLDGLTRLSRLVLRGGGRLSDLSALTRMPSLQHVDLTRCSRLPEAQRQVFEGEALSALLASLDADLEAPGGSAQ